ncbi:MAG: Uncharacterised protein [Bacteroidota bacterium]|nr:MAG: Uncharacterised protein [Bacteroidota bacterium]
MFFFLFFACHKDEHTNSEDTEVEQADIWYKLPDINLTNWKVTLPIGNPTSIKPPEILGYATNDVLKPYMYNDSIEGALVFYTKPGTSTPNSSYSRTELREQMVSGSDYVNWTFKQGARIKGRLRLDEISNDSSGNPYRTIVMQIHGRLTDTQRDLLGQKDNNAPPIMKIYWANGYVRLKSKVLKNPNAVEPEILHTSAWGDDDGYTFPVEVGYDPFTLEIIASEGRMEVILNDTYSRVYQGTDMEKWSVFENYFKAGNYFQTKDENVFSRLKYYILEVMH